MIRTAVESDIPYIMDIYNDAVLNTTATFDINPRQISFFEDMFRQHTGKYLLAVFEDKGEILGYVSLSRYSWRDAYDCTVELSVYVKNGYRNMHIGTKLMDYALDTAKNNPNILTVVSLITSENETSIYLHIKAGFTYSGTIKNAGIKFDRKLSVDIYVMNF
ncbi:N-acetyltransferase family protein [Oscillospiraceae bacterium LCP25S3_E10]|nr:N-acetyltransferase family protein [Ruminococcus sp.]MDD6448003.1 GNAT family N-acetyltransferase [Ruminococcus sp.]